MDSVFHEQGKEPMGVYVRNFDSYDKRVRFVSYTMKDTSVLYTLFCDDSVVFESVRGNDDGLAETRWGTPLDKKDVFENIAAIHSELNLMHGIDPERVIYMLSRTNQLKLEELELSGCAWKIEASPSENGWEYIVSLNSGHENMGMIPRLIAPRIGYMTSMGIDGEDIMKCLKSVYPPRMIAGASRQSV